MKRHFRQLLKKKLKADTIIMISIYLMVPFVIGAMTLTRGTPNPDCQLTNGTVNPDHIIQQSYGDNDSQMAYGQESNDTIVQDGGTEDDNQTAYGNEGDDYILQRGKDGNDNQYASGNDGNDRLSQVGGRGDDVMQANGDLGNDKILQNGGDGDDDISADGGPGNDNVTILAGDDTGDTDRIDYSCSPGRDNVFIDGGPGYDILTLSCGLESIRESSAIVNGAPLPTTMVFWIGTTKFIIRRVESINGCVNIAGTWNGTVIIDETDCGEGIRTESGTYTATQNGCTVSGLGFTGVLSATIYGNTISWTGNFPEDGGTTTITWSQVIISQDGKSASGSSTWTWTDGVDSCSGITQITGTRSIP